MVFHRLFQMSLKWNCEVSQECIFRAEMYVGRIDQSDKHCFFQLPKVYSNEASGSILRQKTLLGAAHLWYQTTCLICLQIRVTWQIKLTIRERHWTETEKRVTSLGSVVAQPTPALSYAVIMPWTIGLYCVNLSLIQQYSQFVQHTT